MAQTNFTPILTYRSNTAAAVPSAGNLTNSANGAELAVNTADKRLFTKDSGGNVVEIGTNPSSVTLPNGTANGVVYANASKVLTTGSALTFDGTNFVVGGGSAFGGSGYTALTLNNATNGGLLNFANGATLIGQFYGAGNNVTLSTQQSGSTFTLNPFTAAIFQLAGSEGMRLTSTGLGIGTSSPSNKLDVVGTASFAYVNSTGQGTSGVYLAGTSGSSSVTQFGGELRFNTGGTANTPATSATEKMRLDSSGNLGLGVTPSANSSAWKTFEYGIAGAKYGIIGQKTTGNAEGFVGWNVYGGANSTSVGQGYYYKVTGDAASLYTQNGAQHIWWNAPSGTAGNAITFTQAMTLDANGDLAVGSTDADSRFKVEQTGVAGLRIAFNNTSQNFYDADLQVFRTGDGSERARIDSSGNLLLGTTSGTAKLQVAGQIRSTGVVGDYAAYFTQAGGADRDVLVAGIAAVSNGFQVQYVSSAMKYTLTGLGSGTVTSSSGVLSAVSDQNMKVADGEVENAIDKVLALKPRYFYWKDKNGNADTAKRRQLGFYAQEVNLVVPEASPAPIVESDGWGVYDRSLVATLVKAMQEQQAIITSLTARVASLESN